MKYLYSFGLFALLLIGYTIWPMEKVSSTKINGLCLVAPPFRITTADYTPILSTNANWVAITPYAFCSSSKPTVRFDHPNQWWGEKAEGIETAIMLAQAANLKIMMKPHLWVLDQGWAGDLYYEQEDDLAKWMKSYSDYLIRFSEIAEKHKAEMLSIGTETRHLAKNHPEYFELLISQIRSIYSGKLTYSANWDNYQNITFWDKLDYIGVDAYFPTSETKTPSTSELDRLNADVGLLLEDFSKKYDKKIIFTEYGFQSKDYCTRGHWNNEKEDDEVNLQAQANAYTSFLNTFWKEPWFAGGFAWKWHYHHNEAGGKTNSEFTPQNKSAENVLKNWYSNYR